jgi:hypothetical protein
LVAANAGKAALRTIAAESASVVLLNIFISRLTVGHAVALSYERLPLVFIPGRLGAKDRANIAKLPEPLRKATPRLRGDRIAAEGRNGRTK